MQIYTIICLVELYELFDLPYGTNWQVYWNLDKYEHIKERIININYMINCTFGKRGCLVSKECDIHLFLYM